MKYSKRGMTFVELLVVIAVVGMLVAVVAVPFGNFRKTQSIENSANMVVSILNEARARTLGGVGNTNYGVHFLSGSVVLFTGGTYSAGASTNETFNYESPVVLGTVSINGGGSDVVFDRLKGTTNHYGTINLSISGGATRTITVTAPGAVTRN